MRRTAADIARAYDANAPDELRYLARRAPDPKVAMDLLAETFAVAIEKHDRTWSLTNPIVAADLSGQPRPPRTGPALQANEDPPV